LHNWIDEAWIRPGWSTSDGRKDFISIAFATLAMTMSVEALFGCSTLVLDLSCGLVLVEETMAYMSSSMVVSNPSSFEVPRRHCKDPIPPWNIHVELSRHAKIL